MRNSKNTNYSLYFFAIITAFLIQELYPVFIENKTNWGVIKATNLIFEETLIYQQLISQSNLIEFMETGEIQYLPYLPIWIGKMFFSAFGVEFSIILLHSLIIPTLWLYKKSLDNFGVSGLNSVVISVFIIFSGDFFWAARKMIESNDVFAVMMILFIMIPPLVIKNQERAFCYSSVLFMIFLGIYHSLNDYYYFNFASSRYFSPSANNFFLSLFIYCISQYDRIKHNYYFWLAIMVAAINAYVYFLNIAVIFPVCVYFAVNNRVGRRVSGQVYYVIFIIVIMAPFVLMVMDSNSPVLSEVTGRLALADVKEYSYFNYLPLWLIIVNGLICLLILPFGGPESKYFKIGYLSSAFLSSLNTILEKIVIPQALLLHRYWIVFLSGYAGILATKTFSDNVRRKVFHSLGWSSFTFVILISTGSIMYYNNIYPEKNTSLIKIGRNIQKHFSGDGNNYIIATESFELASLLRSLGEATLISNPFTTNMSNKEIVALFALNSRLILDSEGDYLNKIGAYSDEMPHDIDVVKGNLIYSLDDKMAYPIPNSWINQNRGYVLEQYRKPSPRIANNKVLLCTTNLRMIDARKGVEFSSGKECFKCIEVNQI